MAFIALLRFMAEGDRPPGVRDDSTADREFLLSGFRPSRGSLGERVGRREVEIAVVAAESLCDECGRGVAEDRGGARCAADGRGVDESGGECVTAASSVDREGQDTVCAFGGGDDRTLCAQCDGEQSRARVERDPAALGDVGGFISTRMMSKACV
ncbi:hypothetical protein [Nocardia sp. NBC_01730]|uniref:hypothetical protein n=1 Tax=Nocardia sp. NBC_01730 TaxID=2975998 RepID=UPI003FA3DA54